MPFAPRLYSPDAPGLTLREAFDVYYAPELLKRDGTRKAFGTLLNQWEAHSANPRVHAITSETWAEFSERLAAGEYAESTIAKSGKHLRALLRRLGPKTDRNPQGKAVIPETPYIKIPKLGRRLPKIVALEVIDRLYLACGGAGVVTWPKLRDVDPADYWRALICATYNLGPRTFEIVHDRSDPQTGWLWANYHAYEPSAIGTPLMSITFLREKTRDELLLPVNPVLQSHLALIRTDRRAIFPVSKHHDSFYGQFIAIKQAAGLYVPDSDYPSFQSLRRTCETRWNRVHPKFGGWIVGHMPHDVAGKFYENYSRDVADACESLPQPAAFLSVFDRKPRGRQKFLFD